MTAREIITLQLGNAANYVGAHFWNLQDEVLGYASKEGWSDYLSCVDTDVLYQAGEDKQGHATYTPRVLMVDKCGALGGVRFSADAGLVAAASLANEPVVSTWGGTVEVHAAAKLPKSRFISVLEQQAEDVGKAGDGADEQELEEAARALDGSRSASGADDNLDTPCIEGKGKGGVKYWTDYLKALISPSSVYTLPGIWHGVSEFSGYGEGCEIMRVGSVAHEELSDRVRLLAEACGSIQGFQVLSEDQGGFGGVTQYLLEEIHQEFGSGRPTLLFSIRDQLPPLSSDASPAVRTRTAINEALSLSSLMELSSVYIPLSLPSLSPSLFPRLRVNPTSLFHTSAIAAAAIDCVTLPTRLAGSMTTPCGPAIGGMSLHALTSFIRGRGLPGLSSLHLSMPAPALQCDASNQHQASQAADSRTKPPHSRASGLKTPSPTRGLGEPSNAASSAASAQGVGAGAGGSQSDWFDPWTMATLSPALITQAKDVMAEVITLRGPRGVTGPAPSASALGALDSSLTRGPRRLCPVHRAVVPLPLLVPLPYPHVWGPRVGAHGDIEAPGWADTAPNAGAAVQGAASQKSAQPQSVEQVLDVLSVPVATKLCVAPGYRAHVEEVTERWKEACYTAMGKSMLESWDYCGDDLGVVSERLQAIAGEYAHDSDDGGDV